MTNYLQTKNKRRRPFGMAVVKPAGRRSETASLFMCARIVHEANTLFLWGLSRPDNRAAGTIRWPPCCVCHAVCGARCWDQALCWHPRFVSGASPSNDGQVTHDLRKILTSRSLLYFYRCSSPTTRAGTCLCSRCTPWMDARKGEDVV